MDVASVRVLVTGGCGFVGAAIARHLTEHVAGVRVTALDSLRRAGAEKNRTDLRRRGVTVLHGDVRLASDVAAAGDFDFIVDAAAEPSVLAGTAAQGGRGVTSRQLVEHNLVGTIHLLEAAARTGAGVVLLSTSRVYSIAALTAAPLTERPTAFAVDAAKAAGVTGLGPDGVTEAFSTAAPVSLYGATKLASEVLAAEYALAHGFPLFVLRCGVLAGAGQFGRADQGIYSYWIRSWRLRRPLRYIGFGGTGRQVRDCLHAADLARFVAARIGEARRGDAPVTVNVSGGAASATSLLELSRWCAERFGPHDVAASAETRPYDLPWLVLDSGAAGRRFSWRPEVAPAAIFEEIAAHAAAHPDWIDAADE